MKDIDVVGLIKLLIGALAPAAVFYAFGYTITRAYVVSTGLQASFWFTENFYREAGARFLLDIVVAMALLPHLFIPLSALLLVLLPGEVPARWRGWFADLSHRVGFAKVVVLREAAFALLVLLAVSAIVFVLIDCGAHSCATLRDAPRWLFTSSWLLTEAEDKWLVQQPSLFPMVIFLSLAVPTTLTLGVWAYRILMGGPSTAADPKCSPKIDAKAGTVETAHPIAAFLVASTFVVLTFYIPIAYGAYFYDFVVVRLVNSDKCAVQTKPKTGANAGEGGGSSPGPGDDAADIKPIECYLLGRFDETRYILIGRDQLDTERKIYIKQVTQLEPFAIESWVSTPLRSLKAFAPTAETHVATNPKDVPN
jgi:hypothetical protein